MAPRLTALFLLCSLLGACGWGLRGVDPNPGASLGTLMVVGNGVVSSRVRQELKISDTELTVVRSEADYIVWVGDEEQERRSASYDTLLRTSEFELIVQAKFELRTNTGLTIIGPENIYAERVFEFEVNAVTSSAAQEFTVRDELRNRLVDQVINRLAALDPAAIAEKAAQIIADSKQPGPGQQPAVEQLPFAGSSSKPDSASDTSKQDDSEGSR